MSKTVCLIPARGGSKRIPNKNQIDFFGKPMIMHTLEAARDSGIFSDIVVSTDSKEIQNIAASEGFDIIDRPKELATDTASLVPVTLHYLDYLQEKDVSAENACMLMANCPVRDKDDIRDSWEAFQQSSSGLMVSVFKYGMFHPFWALKQTVEGLKPFWHQYYQYRSQELPEVFCPSGAIRWFNIDTFKKEQDFYGSGVTPYVLPWYKAVDIDEFDDLFMAEMVVSFMNDHPELLEKHLCLTETNN